jgi:hypothetical protein
MMKTCKVCGQSLPIGCFTKHPMSADGYQPKCRSCRAEYDRARYELVRDKLLQSARAWKLANPERARQHGRKADAKRIAKKLASWRLYEPAVKRATPTWADTEAIEMFYSVAEVLSRSGAKFEVDHIVPIRGKQASGLHVQDNLRVVPRHENRSKGNRLIST